LGRKSSGRESGGKEGRGKGEWNRKWRGEVWRFMRLGEVASWLSSVVDDRYHIVLS